MLKLNETLKICLLALASQYPDCLVEMNQAVLDLTDVSKGDCTAEQALEQLQVHAPHLLQERACLLIDEKQAISNIYLLDRSEALPAFQLYCGKDPCKQLDRRHMLHEPCLVLSQVDW
jgi:hypothetical protein